MVRMTSVRERYFFQRKVLYTFHVAGLFQVIPHQDDSFLHQQELRCPAGSVGSLFLSGFGEM